MAADRVQWRAEDSDETAGRLLYRQIAEAGVQRQIALLRKVWMTPKKQVTLG